MKHIARHRHTQETRVVDSDDLRSEYYSLDKREWEFIPITNSPTKPLAKLLVLKRNLNPYPESVEVYTLSDTRGLYLGFAPWTGPAW